MVTKSKYKTLTPGRNLPVKKVKNLPKNFFYLFNEFTDKTIEDWVKKKVCFGDKALYKYISEYSKENIKKFRARVQRLTQTKRLMKLLRYSSQNQYAHLCMI